jgi:hypothetical protein
VPRMFDLRALVRVSRSATSPSLSRSFPANSASDLGSTICKISSSSFTHAES